MGAGPIPRVADPNETPSDAKAEASVRVATTAAIPALTASARQPLPPLRGGGQRVNESALGMVTSVVPQATRAGVAMLEAGGNAVDAAVAVGYALAVTHPSAGNIGGGGFMLVRAQGQTRAIDFRERAPLSATPARFVQMLARRATGADAVGVPGSVAGLDLAHQTYGRLPLARVLAPAIALAAEGHLLAPEQANALARAWPRLKRNREARKIFGSSSNPARPKRAGQRLQQPDLARTLRAIAKDGAEGFYGGATAELFVRFMEKSGGLIDHQDLRSYTAKFREPLHTQYRGYDVAVMSPPSAGGVAVVEMLAMLQAENAHELPNGSPEALHLFAEVAKRAHADRRFHVVDPDSVEDYDQTARRNRYVSGGDWRTRFPIVDRATPGRTLHPLYAAAKRELDNTTHFSVVDAEGNAVSCTTTLSAGYGAKVVVPGLGVVLNNSLAAFGSVGEDVLKPGRRMTSSMSPTLVSDGDQVVLVLGSPGGDTIPNTVVQVLRNVVDYGMTLDDAVDYPRVHHGYVPDALRYESSRPPARGVPRALRARGHHLESPRRVMGDANNILVTNGRFTGYADPREGGLALGPIRVTPERTP